MSIESIQGQNNENTISPEKIKKLFEILSIEDYPGEFEECNRLRIERGEQPLTEDSWVMLIVSETKTMISEYEGIIETYKNFISELFERINQSDQQIKNCEENLKLALDKGAPLEIVEMASDLVREAYDLYDKDDMFDTINTYKKKLNKLEIGYQKEKKLLDKIDVLLL